MEQMSNDSNVREEKIKFKTVRKLWGIVSWADAETTQS